MKNNRIVVIGSGVAGCEVALDIKKKRPTSDVTIVSNENMGLYDKPSLSKKYLSGDIDREGVIRRSPSEIDRLGVKTIFACNAEKVDTQQKLVILKGEKSLAYDKLVIATGGRSRLLNVEGEEYSNIGTLRTLADASEIVKISSRLKKIVIIGAGFLALEAAAEFAKMGKDVSILVRSGGLLRKFQNDILSTVVERKLREHGVGILHNKSVRKFIAADEPAIAEARGNKHARSVLCEDGTQYQADLFLVAIGMIPNTELASDTGIEIQDGIKTDRFGQTNVRGIFAVGDCVCIFDPDSGACHRSESIYSAITQARVVSSVISGSDLPTTSIPTFWSELSGLKIQIFGNYEKVDQQIIRGSIEKNSFTLLNCKDGKLIGAFVVNNPGDLMFVRKQIMSNADVGALTDVRQESIAV